MFTEKANTDITIPASYLTSLDPNEYSQCCMVDTNADFVKNVKNEDILVAGLNFNHGPTAGLINSIEAKEANNE